MLRAELARTPCLLLPVKAGLWHCRQSHVENPSAWSPSSLGASDLCPTASLYQPQPPILLSQLVRLGLLQTYTSEITSDLTGNKDTATDASSLDHSAEGGVASPAALISPQESEGGDSETDDDAGSEYTANSSTPTTPRSSVIAADATNGKKKKKKFGRKIKKVFSKIEDALTPSSHHVSTT